MPITLITGVPGTGKTAFVVSELEKIVATGRITFVDNIPGLTLEHYRAGKITDWQKGTWLHIDQYKRTGPAIAMSGGKSVPVDDDEDLDDGDGNENWLPDSEVVKDKDGALHRLAFNEHGQAVGSVPYESHKGALLVIDEAQRYFRPRPVGSVVPDHVAALEVHRHQGLDIWLITQRPGLLDANVRALCGKHIAFRDTPFGRYKYEWPEVGDIESKTSRDTAAKSRYRLPKRVFKLYKSAEAHTEHKHTMPMAAKVLAVALPLFLLFLWSSYNTIASKFQPVKPAYVETAMNQSSGKIQQAMLRGPVQQDPSLPSGLKPYNLIEIENHHPFEQVQFSIVGRIKSATKDVFRFSASENGWHSFYTSNTDLVEAGYTVVPLNDCSVKMIYKNVEFFVTCDNSRQPWQPQFQQYPHHIVQQGIQLEPYP